MKLLLIFISLFIQCLLAKENESNVGYVYLVPKNQLTYHSTPSSIYQYDNTFQHQENSLLNALLLSSTLGLSPGKVMGVNHSNQVPINPYIVLLLSQYGRYIPLSSSSSQNLGIYYYAAANNYHNNKPFGSYKVHEEAK